MTDRELLELAAKAAGIDLLYWQGDAGWLCETVDGSPRFCWNPLTDDGDALRLAVNLRLELRQFDDGRTRAAWIDSGGQLCIEDAPDDYAATRRAIVRAAASVTHDELVLMFPGRFDEETVERARAAIGADRAA